MPLPTDPSNEFIIHALRTRAFKLSCADQYRLASLIAENVGYVLTPDPLRAAPAEPADPFKDRRTPVNPINLYDTEGRN